LEDGGYLSVTADADGSGLKINRKSDGKPIWKSVENQREQNGSWWMKGGTKSKEMGTPDRNQQKLWEQWQTLMDGGLKINRKKEANQRM
jgi:hypothetical protein